MPSRSKFLVIEGCNGVGKSTIVEYVSGRVGASTFHYPPEFVSFRRGARSTHTESCHLRSLSGKSPFADDRRIGD